MSTKGCARPRTPRAGDYLRRHTKVARCALVTSLGGLALIAALSRHPRGSLTGPQLSPEVAARLAIIRRAIARLEQKERFLDILQWNSWLFAVISLFGSCLIGLAGVTARLLIDTTAYVELTVILVGIACSVSLLCAGLFLALHIRSQFQNCPIYSLQNEERTLLMTLTDAPYDRAGS